MMESRETALRCTATRTIRDALRTGAELLNRAGVESARLDAELLLRHVLGVEKAQLYGGLASGLDDATEREYEQLLLRRIDREPVAYIVGSKEFWSCEFVVTPEVLIPRPETELVVELALELFSAGSGVSNPRILDLGTGSGAIAVSLAKELPGAQVCAVELSPAAIEIARLNSRRHGVEKRVMFFCGDLFAPLIEERRGFDLIVSNPPYICSGEIAGLAPEIRNWEPVAALDGGSDGLRYYRAIVAAAANYLRAGGSMLLELGDGMGRTAARLIEEAGGFGAARIFNDYAGKDRVIAAAKITPAAGARPERSRG